VLVHALLAARVRIRRAVVAPRAPGRLHLDMVMHKAAENSDLEPEQKAIARVAQVGRCPPVTNAVLVPIFLLEIGFQGLAILEVLSCPRQQPYPARKTGSL